MASGVSEQKILSGVAVRNDCSFMVRRIHVYWPGVTIRRWMSRWGGVAGAVVVCRWFFPLRIDALSLLYVFFKAESGRPPTSEYRGWKGGGVCLLKMQMSRPCPRFSPLRISVWAFVFLTCTSWFCTLKLGVHCSVPGCAVSSSQTSSLHHILVNLRLKKQKHLRKAPGI